MGGILSLLVQSPSTTANGLVVLGAALLASVGAYMIYFRARLKPDMREGADPWDIRRTALAVAIMVFSVISASQGGLQPLLAFFLALFLLLVSHRKPWVFGMIVALLAFGLVLQQIIS
ncbi:hypothetical protein [Sphingomonas hengshuiensis]|uniref:Uncharacterized protein n=1 Tax=Sphingomonas hengshuiensis TaxID=1609977 RepID=A0A7U4JA19_9SPHN|nr:hypothetical protein [Sphingomonas hengshuiensis]AJP72991.1 hypothetical protein TS85_16110 [Sphingomonas hengshuiensis]